MFSPLSVSRMVFLIGKRLFLHLEKIG